MNALHMLDVKEHNGQVRRALPWQRCACAQVGGEAVSGADCLRAPNQETSVNINFEILTLATVSLQVINVLFVVVWPKIACN